MEKNTENNILNIVKENIDNNKLIDKGDKIVVAVSGGPDSMCLLDILFKLKEELKIEIVVAHVNHGIREVSESEKDYVEAYCNEKKIPFYYKKVNIPRLSKEQKISEETCGRNVRYEFFEELRNKLNFDYIAVAHNSNDNVETIMLNIIRGCGLKGLVGIDMKFDKIIRPILTIEKKDILVYNQKAGLNPCFDETNNQDIYLRNKVRLQLIPALEEINPNFSNGIIRMKEILREDNDFIDSYVEIKLKEVILEEDKSKIVFDFSLILKEHISVRKRLIRKIIERKISNLNGIENIYIMDILRLFENNIKGKKYMIGNKFNIEIIRKNVAIIY